MRPKKAKVAGAEGGEGGVAAANAGFGESIAPDAPQPTDDGLAVVAEIGGDLEAPVLASEVFDGRAPRADGDRGGRRSRRSRSGRNRFPPRVSEYSVGEAASAEPGLLDALAALPTDQAQSEGALASAAEPVAFAWTPEPHRAYEASAAPSTQPNVEENCRDPRRSLSPPRRPRPWRNASRRSRSRPHRDADTAKRPPPRTRRKPFLRRSSLSSDERPARAAPAGGSARARASSETEFRLRTRRMASPSGGAIVD